METLFILKQKFGNRRVVRNIYEFADERKYWLKKYRYVIKNGYCLCRRPGKYNKGVFTFELIAKTKYVRQPGFAYNRSYKSSISLYYLINYGHLRIPFLYANPGMRKICYV